MRLGSRVLVDDLWVAALVSEVAPLVAALSRPRLLSHRLCVGGLDGRTVAVLRCGVGPQRARSGTRNALKRVSAREVWSLGSCGALVDDLKVGDLVTADWVLHLSRLQPADPVDGVRVGRVLTVDAPIFTAARRLEVARLGALVCEMEAAGVADAAEGKRVRVLKVVSDRAGAEPDAAIDGVRAVAMARFHVRVERLMRTCLLPALRQT